MTVTPPPARHPVEPTIHRLLQERLLRGSEVLSGETRLQRDIRWCHSLHDVSRDGMDDLRGVVVLAEPSELDEQAWTYLMSSGCEAVFVRGSVTVPPAATGPDGEEMVVVRLPESIARTSVLQLVSAVSLTHHAHVLEYGQEVHSTLANLLHRGGGLTALCSRLAAVSHSAVAVLGQDLHLLAFDPGRGGPARAELRHHRVQGGPGEPGERRDLLRPALGRHHRAHHRHPAHRLCGRPHRPGRPPRRLGPAPRLRSRHHRARPGRASCCGGAGGDDLRDRAAPGA